MAIDFIPFEAHMLAEAGQLLALRHRKHRADLPELPARFEDPFVACGAVQATLNRPEAIGFAALRNGRLIAYLIGETNFEDVWGRSGWIRQAGCAYAPDESVEVVRDLYAMLGAQWLTLGCFAHFALIPATDVELNRAWYSLSFGIQQVYALAGLDQLDIAKPMAQPNVEIRRTGPAERDALLSLASLIWEQHLKAPVWAIKLPEQVADTRQSWAELVDDPTAAAWIAFEDEVPVGVQAFYTSELADDNLLVPEKCVHFTLAATRAETRGRGIGRALAHEVFSYAIANGMLYADTDWRSTNLLGSRVWPHLGFRPAFYRLVRLIDPRIAWANGIA